MCLRQYLLILFVAYTSALEPLCCERDNFDQNQTSVECDSSIKNSYLSSMCRPPWVPFTFGLDKVEILLYENKTLILEIYDNINITFNNGSFCFLDKFNTNTSKFEISHVVVCGLEDPDKDNPYVRIRSIFMLVSTCFYLLTAIIYILLPALRDQLGMCVIHYCFAMGMGLFMMSYMNLVPYTIWDRDHGFCAARGFFAYFFLVAGFFWSNVISIQTLRSVINPSSPAKDWKVFSRYTAYGWGVPVILTSITAAVNFYPGDHAKPGIGLETCFFINNSQRWYYLYSVMTLLFVVNFCIFVYVSIVLWRSTHFKSDNARDVRYKFSLTWKICFLMGLPWMIEIISSLITSDTIKFILDVLNELQGIVIFVILVVLRKQAMRAMHERGWCLCLNGVVSKYLNKGNDAEADVVPQTDLPDVTVVDSDDVDK